MAKYTRRYSKSERALVRKLWRAGKKDPEIAEQLSVTRPGTNPKAIQTVRSKWGYVGFRIRKDRHMSEPKMSRKVIVRVGQAEFHTDKITAKIILEILAGI